MRKQLMTLAVLAAFAAPAFAQSGYDDPAANIAAGANSGVVEPGTSNDPTDNSGIDATTTGSINGLNQTDTTGNGNGLCDNGAGANPSSDPQCQFYGANSR